jgi:hypothetical protein
MTGCLSGEIHGADQKNQGRGRCDYCRSGDDPPSRRRRRRELYREAAGPEPRRAF